MSSAAEPTGTIDIALKHTGRLLDSNPVLAVEQATEILKVAPNHPVATLLLGVAQRSSGDLESALCTLHALVAAQPRAAAAHYELGLSLTEARDYAAAAAELRCAVALKPDMPDAWRALGDVLTFSGDLAGADTAYASHIRASTTDLRLLAPASALVENRIPEAESLLRAHLLRFPSDVAAIRMLAEVAARLGRYVDAENLLVRCLELAPSFNEARHNYAIVLLRRNKPVAALAQLNELCRLEPRNPAYRNSKAVVLTKIGDFAESLELFAGVLAVDPKQWKIWLSYGHALATAGREAESIEAYRRCIGLTPGCGEAWWNLANLKTFRFSDAELSAMRAQLARSELTAHERFHFHFAVGKALEDARQFGESFEHYALGNSLRRAQISYAAEHTSALVRRSRELLTAEFFRARAGHGSQAPDTIFIVGLPRSGSTLIEQILASHSAVEGTMELQDILFMAGKLRGEKGDPDDAGYPAVLADLSAERCRALAIPITRRDLRVDCPSHADG